MDSVSHIRVANLLMDYVEQTCGVTFDQSGFIYGNLKPDLTGTYLTKRHNPSIMMDEVMEKIRTFTHKYTIGRTNGRELSVDLGEICHYMTDFFTYPHNDDIYEHNLLAHYVYEKRVALVIRRRMTEDKFEKWASPIIPPTTVDTLVNRISTMPRLTALRLSRMASTTICSISASLPLPWCCLSSASFTSRSRILQSLPRKTV